MARSTLIALLYVWGAVIVFLVLAGIGISRQRARRRRKDAPQPVPDPSETTAGKPAHGRTAHLLL